MIDFGFDKLALIGAVALIVIGPEKLPRVARTVGTLLGKAQRYVADVKAEVNRSIELEELKKMKTQFEDAARNVEQTVSSEINQTTSRPAGRLAAAGRRAAAAEQRPARRPDAAAAVPASEEELAPEARRACRSGTSSEHGIRAQGAVGRGARGALPAAARACGAMSADERPDDELAGTEQPFVSHLVELRDRLIRAAIAVGVCFGVLCGLARPGARSTTCSPRRWSRTCPRAAR